VSEEGGVKTGEAIFNSLRQAQGADNIEKENASTCLSATMCYSSANVCIPAMRILKNAPLNLWLSGGMSYI